MGSERNIAKYRLLPLHCLNWGRCLLLDSVSRRSFSAFVLLILSALLLEFMTYQNVAVIAWATPRLWLAGGLLLALVIVGRSVRQLLRDIKNKAFMPILFTLGLVALLAWPLLDPARSVIGQDATQQVAAGLDAFTRPDLNYTGRAFLGYPARQYLLAALPALLAGRSETALQVGFAWPFWLGLLLFADSLRAWGRAKGIRHGDGLALAAVSALFVFPYVTDYYLYFEQTLFPVCFSLQAIGWFLLFLLRPTPFHALALCWTGSILVYCYSPSLAAVALLFVLLLLICLKALLQAKKASPGVTVWPAAFAADPFPALTGLVVAVFILATVVLSLAFGRGDRISVLRSTELSEIIEATKVGLSIAFLHRPATYAGYMLPLVWLYLTFALLFRFGLVHFIVAGWTLGVIILSQVLQGYAIYPAAISFSRTLVTVPVLVTAWYLLAADRLQENGTSFQANGAIQMKPARRRLGVFLLALTILLNLGAGTWNLGRPVVQGSAAQYIAPAYLHDMRLFLSDLNRTAATEKLDAHDQFNLVLYTDNVWLKNPGDYTGYFFPAARVVVLASDMPLPEDLDLQKKTLLYVIHAETQGQFPAGFGQLESTTFPVKDGRPLQIQRLVYRPG
ncbi:MAG: hypothetical protein SCM11_04335 [Bacillota bacterium]|nr:hypothetical protein [Bacillota bacterium]